MAKTALAVFIKIYTLLPAKALPVRVEREAYNHIKTLCFQTIPKFCLERVWAKQDNSSKYRVGHFITFFV